MQNNQNTIYFIMGVSGVGKSTIGTLLAKDLGIPFFDGDDFHPQQNVDKMSSGIPLTDEDRYGWLQTLNQLAKEQLSNNSCVIVCSALKEKYRDILKDGIELNTKWVHLVGSFDLVLDRIQKRINHYMPADLLKSQYDILEAPKDALNVEISYSPQKIVEIINNNTNKSQFGLFGLGVMGKSLSRNLAQKGFNISIFNRHVDDVEEDVALSFKKEYPEFENAQAFDSIQEFVESIEKPRKIMLMVNAGKTIDIVIEDLIPFLSEGDILIDGGNSNYKKSIERSKYLEKRKIGFVDSGVSGGEEGALKGPSIMPGATLENYNQVAPFLTAISAKDSKGLPCCTHIGQVGSGHFVKMIHNGIEYVEMQLLADVFTIFQQLGNTPDEIADILESWKEKSNSYLLEITVDILRKKENNDWIIHSILDKAGNKGTGNWATIATSELGMPSTLLAKALFTRYSSFQKDTRSHLETIFPKTKLTPKLNAEDIYSAYQFSRIINHYQGVQLIMEASSTYNWDINMSEVARIWTNGCIIRSAMMENLVEVLKETKNILTNPSIVKELKSLKDGANRVIAESVMAHIAIPCITDAMSFFNGITTANSSANIIQAQRDYFGAHTYQKVGDTSNRYYHTIWK